MKLDFAKICTEYENCSLKYYEYVNDTSSDKNESYAKRLYKINVALRKDPDFAHKVIDKLIESSNVATVMNISLFAISINYRESDALEKAIAIMNDESNSFACVYVKASLMRMKKI